MEKLSTLDATNEKAKVSHKHIPQDLAFSILSKLPIKSLKRFGCCQKSWNNLFENPNFMTLYCNNLMSNYEDSPLIFVNQSPESMGTTLYLFSGERFENRVKLDWPPTFQENSGRIFVLGSGSINGTLFLYQENTNKMVLWNPATEEFKVIPPSPFESVPPNWNTCSHVQGFGYDHVTDDYKVIRCLWYDTVDDGVDHQDVSWQNVSPLPFWETYKGRNDKYMWEIYSLRRNNWRKLGDDIPGWFMTLRCVCSRVYMDGMCHWVADTDDYEIPLVHTDDDYEIPLVHTDDYEIPLVCEIRLVSFDLSNEVFFTTPMPSDKDEIRAYTDPTEYFYESDVVVERHLVELNGCIGLISNRANTTTFHISILSELGVKESWTRLYIVGPFPCVSFIVGMGQKGDIFFWRKDFKLAWFNLRTQTIEYPGLNRYWFYSGTYKESPLPIGGLNN